MSYFPEISGCTMVAGCVCVVVGAVAILAGAIWLLTFLVETFLRGLGAS